MRERELIASIQQRIDAALKEACSRNASND